MSIYVVTVRHEDETGSRRVAVLVDSSDGESAALLGLEFARNHIFFGAKAEYVEWLESWPVELPYVMRMDARRPKKKRKGSARAKGVEP